MAIKKIKIKKIDISKELALPLKQKVRKTQVKKSPVILAKKKTEKRVVKAIKSSETKVKKVRIEAPKVEKPGIKKVQIEKSEFKAPQIPQIKEKESIMPEIEEPKIQKTDSAKGTDYSAKDIYVLKGLEPVRKRPAMYIGSTGAEGVHHLLSEVVGNSIDEAIMGYCTEIVVSLFPDDRVEVIDNGRGIPVDIHPETKKSALETVITQLHAGAKFGGKTYATTGGLHGVGISAVCALSKYMKAQVCKDGGLYSQEYSRGKVTTKVKKEGACSATGTTITFEPDPQIFKEIAWNPKKILSYLRQQAYLTKGVKIVFWDKRQEPFRSYTFYFEGGLASYIRHLTQGRTPRHPHIFYGRGQINDIIVEGALVYTKEFESFEESFANNVFTPEGGTHLTGMKIAITRTLNDFARKEKILKDKNEILTGKDVREGLTSVVSVKVKEPQFEGQTKKKLGNPEARAVVAEVISEQLMDFLERNPADARAIIENCLLAQKARNAARNAREMIIKKGFSRNLVLPGTLADCSNRDPKNSELYIIEGPSAGGSAKQARDRRFQAILPLRGKILNVEKARPDRILASKEIKSLIIAMGTAIDEDFNINRLRYHRIILMSDADVDGLHIRTLLLTLFYRHFREIIDKGYLFIAQPPLYRIKSQNQIKYVYTEEAKAKLLKELEAKKQTAMDIQRYKGLGEMNPEQLWETTMNPQNRILLKVEIEDAQEADKVFDTLMGEEVLPRKKFIQAYARKVKNLDI